MTTRLGGDHLGGSAGSWRAPLISSWWLKWAGALISKVENSTRLREAQHSSAQTRSCRFGALKGRFVAEDFMLPKPGGNRRELVLADRGAEIGPKRGRFSAPRICFCWSLIGQTCPAPGQDRHGQVRRWANGRVLEAHFSFPSPAFTVDLPLSSRTADGGSPHRRAVRPF